MLLDVTLQAHAWSSARSKQESTLAAQHIEQKIVSVIETEKEQGMFPPALLPPSPPLPSFHPTIVGRQRPIIFPPIHFCVTFFPDVIANYDCVPIYFLFPCVGCVYRTDPRAAKRVRDADENSAGGAHRWTWQLNSPLPPSPRIRRADVPVSPCHLNEVAQSTRHWTRKLLAFTRSY